MLVLINLYVILYTLKHNVKYYSIRIELVNIFTYTKKVKNILLQEC